MNLESAARKKIKTYSAGMKQHLGIAQAVLNDPKILILDEPTAGLDPKERVRFRNLIAELGKDSVVILSTHIVSDVEHIADIKKPVWIAMVIGLALVILMGFTNLSSEGHLSYAKNTREVLIIIEGK